MAPACLERLHTALGSLWTAVPEVPQRDRTLFEIAVIEIAGNVVAHGERTSSFDAWVDLRVTADRLEADLRDTGGQAHLDAAPRMPDPTAEHGRGLPLAREALDVLRYRREAGVNHWRLERAWGPGAEQLRG